MRTVCVINNYNYAKYIEECILSAARQTHPFDVIYIIDDGSTDHSRQIISATQAKFKNIEVIFKKNAGQLSCFNEATKLITQDDFICLLDSDDVLPSDYLATLQGKRQQQVADLYFCEPTNFKDGERPPQSASRTIAIPEFNWLISSHTTRSRRTWTGSPTSCVSLTGALYKQLLPYPFEDDWKTRADDILIYGAAIVGASKCYLPSLTIGYRVHNSNSFFGKAHNAAQSLAYELRLDRLFNYYCQKFLLTMDGRLLEEQTKREIMLVPPQLRARFHLPSNEDMALHSYKGARRTLKKFRLRLKGKL